MTGRNQANQIAASRMAESRTRLLDVAAAGDVVPGMAPNLILTSGPTMPYDAYRGGQRRALVYGALYEGLAGDHRDADEKLRSGKIKVAGCHDHSCVGSVAGIYTASMPVFVIENVTYGNRAYCNFYEGESRQRLNYAVYNDEVRRQLRHIEEVIAPVVGEAVRRAGGISLTPIMTRALHMGDELHSRNTAATMLFARELFPHLLTLADERAEAVREVVNFLAESDYFFLRLSMGSAKATADAVGDIPHSSVVTAMSVWCEGTAIRVSGTGSAWHHGPFPVVAARLFEGYTEADIEWIGGESIITETVGLGGFAQAAAFALQRYQGGNPAAMVALNEAMYDITIAEHPQFKIPFLQYRGVPVGIDAVEVARSGVTPVLDVGLAGCDGGQIGAGTVRAPAECFEAAARALGEMADDAGVGSSQL